MGNSRREGGENTRVLFQIPHSFFTRTIARKMYKWKKIMHTHTQGSCTTVVPWRVTVRPSPLAWREKNMSEVSILGHSKWSFWTRQAAKHGEPGHNVCVWYFPIQRSAACTHHHQGGRRNDDVAASNHPAHELVSKVLSRALKVWNLKRPVVKQLGHVILSTPRLEGGGVSGRRTVAGVCSVQLPSQPSPGWWFSKRGFERLCCGFALVQVITADAGL